MIFEPKLCKFKIDEDYETQMRMYEALWPKENPFIRKEIIMNNHIFKKEPVTPVMAEHIKRVNFCPPNIDIETASDEGINQAIGVLREHIYAKVVDMQDKVIVDAVIDFARSEGFTDAYLIDKTYIMAALESKQLQDELERDLEDAEERNNVKDAEIDNLRVEIDGLRNTVNAKDAQIRKLVADLDEYKGCFGDDPRAAKKLLMELNAQIDELRNHTNNQRKQIETQAETIRRYREDNKELIAANENLNYRINNMDKKLREPVDDNRDMVIENQAKYIHELEYKLGKYRGAGLIIKASLEVAEDPEGK